MTMKFITLYISYNNLIGMHGIPVRDFKDPKIIPFSFFTDHWMYAELIYGHCYLPGIYWPKDQGVVYTLNVHRKCIRAVCRVSAVLVFV